MSKTIIYVVMGPNDSPHRILDTAQRAVFPCLVPKSFIHVRK
jgi:hypothetical protein